AVMRLLGAGFVDIRQMVWFSSLTTSAMLARRARDLLQLAERQVDHLSAVEQERFLEVLGSDKAQKPSVGSSS
ncbi:MAG: hypothetical protein V2A76_12300, partial [Planctomycetota bacterium]